MKVSNYDSSGLVPKANNKVKEAQWERNDLSIRPMRKKWLECLANEKEMT